MAGPKFFIHGGCRWREIDTASGSVAGWGNVQFLSVHCGRLQVARKSSVLRGLRSLAASKPTSVHDGPPLSQIRQTDAIEDKKDYNCIQYQHRCCCRKQDLCYNADAIFNNLIKSATSNATVQCSLSEVNTCFEPKPSKSTALSTKKRISNITNYNHNEEKRLLAERTYSISDDETEVSRKNRPTRSKIIESDSDFEFVPLLNGKNSQESIKKAPFHTVNSTKFIKTKLGKSKTSRKLSSTEDEVQEILPRRRKSLRLNHESRGILGEGTNLRESLKEQQVRTVNSDKNSKNKLGKTSKKQSTTDEELPKKLTKSPRKIQENHATSSIQLKERSTRNSQKNSTYIIPENNDKQALRRSKRKLSISEDDAEVRKVIKTKRNINNLDFGATSTQRQTQESENGDLCKELLIGEEDVQLLRTFIERDEANIFRVDLERFDADDDYKGMIFYKLNPLVNIARCKRIAAMLRDQHSPSNTVSFEDFISKLGLRSVLDSSSQSSSKYRMRPRRTKDMHSTAQHTSESELDKENYKKSKRDHSKTSHNKVLVESIRDIGNKKNTIISKKVKKHAVGLVGKMSSKPQRSKKDSTDVLSLSSDSDSVFEKSKQSVQTKQSEQNKQSVRNERADEQRLKPTVVLKRVRAGRVDRPGGRVGREYSRAEDEAVVRWVRGAGRARRVNGNQLWRELQPIHQQRTGQFRSWHSLRNRYLRYLLPALGALALPPHEAARLRADAAAGEIKSRKKPQRRKTLLIEPRVVSAWSRRPRSPPRESSPSHSRSASPLPSPSPSSTPPRIRTTSLPVRKNASSHSYSPTDIDGDDSETTTVSRDKWKSKVKAVNKSSRQLRSSDISSNKEKQMLSYSQLTRRFADKHSTPSGGDVTPPERRNKQTDTHRPRTRRLYNPNAI